MALYRGLSPHLRDDGALTALGSGSIRRLALLPHRNQEQLVTILRRERFSPQQSATYLDLWRKATTDEARQYLLTHPREAVRLASQKAKKTPAADPRLGEAGQYVVNALLAMEQVSLRILQRLQKGVEDLTPSGVPVVEAARHQCQAQCRAALTGVLHWLGGPSQPGETDHEEQKTTP